MSPLGESFQALSRYLTCDNAAALQEQSEFITTLSIMGYWLEERRRHIGVKRVPCSQIPETLWLPLLTSEQDISLDDFAKQLRDGLGLWCIGFHLKQRLVLKKSGLHQAGP